MAVLTESWRDQWLKLGIIVGSFGPSILADSGVSFGSGAP